MGSSFQSIVDVDATAEAAATLADRLLAWLVERGEVEPGGVTRDRTAVEGVVVDTRRRVYYSLTGEQDIRCPHCAGPTTLEDHLGDVIAEWHEGGSGLAGCPNCQREVGLNDWRWSPPWAFGNLGITFWDWTWFSDAYLDEVSEFLGHRVVRAYGKL